MGSQVPTWMNESRSSNIYGSIQIPSIGGVEFSSDEDSDDGSPGKFHKNDSPKTKVSAPLLRSSRVCAHHHPENPYSLHNAMQVFSREQIKAMAERRYQKSLKDKGGSDED